MELSIIIPCFNESEGIAHLASRLKGFEAKLNYTHEFIFVDDGSSDSTYERLKNFYKDRVGNDVNIVKHPENRGIGAALKTGILNSTGDYVAVIDSDCTYEPNYLLKMFVIIKDQKADIITASPYHPEGRTPDVPLYRLFLSRGLSKIYNIVTKSKLYTYTSIFRIYRRDAIKSVDFRSDGFLAMAEILVEGHKKGFKIIEYPAALTGRKFGASSAKILKLIKEHLCFITKILFRRTHL